MSDRAKFALNFGAQFAVLASQFLISFVLTPIVLTKLGDEAYGFVGLVNNFVSYISIVSAALNAVSGRFITVAYHGGKLKETDEYFSSIFFANCIMAASVMVGSIALSMNIEHLVEVSPDLLLDLRITVLIAFLNAGVGLVNVVFGVAAFIKNELFFNLIGQLLGSMLRVALLFILFWTAAPHMWYFSISAIAATVLTGVIQAMVTRRLLPNVRISVSHFNPSRVLEMIKIGIWGSLQRINVLLQTGLDLLIANLFLGGAAMGLLSIAKTVPQALTSLSGYIANLFFPKMAEAYAKDDLRSLVRQLSVSMRFTAGVMIVPLTGFIGFGSSFYELWLPGRSAAELSQIELLTALTMVTLLASALVEPLYYADTLTTKLRGSVLITFAMNIVAVIIELSLLMASDLDKLSIIAGTSSIIMVLRHLVAQPLYCARVLNVSSRPFFKAMAKELGTMLVLWGAYYFINSVADISSWGSFLLHVLVAGVFGYVFVFFVLFNRGERASLFRSTLSRKRH